MVVAALSLTGCSLATHAGAAAVIGDVRFTDSALAAEYTSMVNAIPEGASPAGTASEMHRTIIQDFIYNTALKQIAADLGTEVTPAEIKSVRQELEVKYGGEQGLIDVAAAGGTAPEAIDRTLETSLLFQAIGKKLEPAADETTQSTAANAKFMEYMASLSIEISPRYGEWNPETITIGDATSGLSVTMEQLLAQAAAEQ